MAVVRHRVYGAVVACAEPLTAPRDQGNAAPALVLTLEAAREPAPISTWAWQLQTPTGAPFLLGTRRGDCLWLRFAALADVEVNAARERARVWPHPGVAADELQRLLLDQVVPRVLAGQGHSVLHASAVLAPQGVLAFVGDSGVGKSTLAARLAAAGLPVMADDALVVEKPLVDAAAGRWLAHGAYPGLRLDDPSSGGKRRVAAGIRFAAGPQPLAAVYLLDRAESGAPPGRRPLAGATALASLLRHSYRLDAGGRDEVAHGFERLAELVRQVPLWRLSIGTTGAGGRVPLAPLATVLELSLR
jgi:hypothetical protein